MKFLTTLFCAFLFLQVNAQVWDKTLTDSVNVKAISPTSDGGCIILGNRSTVFKMTVIKVDGLGRQQWIKDFADLPTVGINNSADKVKILQNSDGTYWVGVNYQVSTDLTIAKLDKDGNSILIRKLPLKNAEINVLNNQLAIFGINTTNSLTTIMRLNTNGDTLNINTLPSIKFTRSPYYVSTIKNNGLLIYNVSDSISRGQTMRIGFDGTIISKTLLSSDISFFVSAYPLTQIIKTSDGSYLIPDSTNVVKVDSGGQLIWRKPIGIINSSSSAPAYLNYLMAPTQDGGFIAIKNNIGLKYLEIKKFSGDGIIVSSAFGFYSNTLNNPYMIRAARGGFIIAGNAEGATQFGSKVRLIKLEENGYFYQYFIKGNVFSDRDNNCQLSIGDIPTQRIVITAKKTGFPDIYALTDSFGKYNLNVDLGSYTIAVVKPNKYTTPCTPSVSKTISTTNPLDSVDFALKSDFFCGLMQVDITTPRLRRCFNNTYTVNYCNSGTATAVNAYVNITVDSLMEFISASKPVATRTGRTYRFNLGDVAMNNCGTFDITTRVRCGDSTRLNQTLCMEAKIYPDTICVPDNTLWTGANLIVSGTCQGDSVVFQVRNGGRAASSASPSLIVENLNSTTFSVPTLPVNGVLTKKYPSNGNTWRMIVNQEPNHPRSTQPTAFVEGCRRAGVTNFATGFGAVFPNDDADISLDVDCQPIIGSYDPNDKIGYPLGTGTTRAIGQNQDIEYMIRFQNTGSDTAFTVVVRDTIDIATLDLTSIEWGASSHKFKPEIYNTNVIKFTFDNILLVDSFTNEPKSNGFVKFRIKQKKDVAFGTKIQNSAGIYFDFNDPVLTNKTLHTVSKNIVTATVDKSNAAYETIKVYPNPATETMFFELEKGQFSIATFELFDMLGKRLVTQNFSGKTFEFNRQSIPSGVYLFKISTDNKIIGTGKLVIQ
jgi:uncharacterized repeat protein (TIGR01451 family)